jgi:hypothetical protein
VRATRTKSEEHLLCIVITSLKTKRVGNILGTIYSSSSYSMEHAFSTAILMHS